MVNYFIYARDCSFSTSGNGYYHTNGLKTLAQFKRDVENIKEEQLVPGEPPAESKIVYLHWGDDCWDVDEDETRLGYVNLQCEQMGTEPEWIIRHLQNKYIIDDNDKIKLLYIITDGLISNESAKKCSRRNEFMDYETVVLHAFNEDPEKIDLSVAASFFKNRCIIYRNYKLCVSVDISKEFDYDKIDVYNFAAKKDQLKSYITLKFINEFQRNADALQEINKLKKLQDRLSDELSDTMDSKKIKFTNKDLNFNLIVPIIVLKVDIEKSISVLINCIVSNAKSYSFNNLMFDIEDDKSVEEEQIDDVDFTTEQEFEIFDFTLEDCVGISLPYENRTMVDAT
uniref:Uncharacterized protein n=1 Tax=Glyptapanteles flavicoxis TaxID=463051 RepID=B7S8I1_9HYME|nr:conserved hypothetical protein [Glyptapanteles flavicoxis]